MTDKPNRTLFDISEDLLALHNVLIETEGELPDEDTERLVDAWLESLGAERDAKLDSYAYLLRTIETDADALDLEIDRLKERRKLLDHRWEKMRERLELFFTRHEIERIQTNRFTFVLQKAGGKPKVILDPRFIEHPEELPEGCRRVKFEPDLVSIREKLEANDPDVKEWASFAEPRKALRIK